MQGWNDFDSHHSHAQMERTCIAARGRSVSSSHDSRRNRCRPLCGGGCRGAKIRPGGRWIRRARALLGVRAT